MELNEDELLKLKTDEYVVLTRETFDFTNQRKNIDELISHYSKVLDMKLSKELINFYSSGGYKLILYNNENIDLRIYSKLSNIVDDLIAFSKSKNSDLVFRGHGDANYYLISSLLRSEKSSDKESKYYYDIIKAQPKWFTDAKYHLDFLKVMQHYFADTRIMDVSTQILPVIYFAVEKDYDKLGEIIIFDKAKKPDMIKRLNSDTVEILSSLPALKEELKDNIRQVAEKYIAKYSNEDERIEAFNKNKSVKKLIHEVGQVRLNFEPVIDPCHLFNVYFSDSTFDNERITNQAGEFIIHGFIEKEKLNEDLNKMRFERNNKKSILLLHNKVQIKKDLNFLGIKESTIYPSLQNTIIDIKNQEN